MKPEYYTVPLDVFKLTKKHEKWPLKDDFIVNDDIKNVPTGGGSGSASGGSGSGSGGGSSGDNIGVSSTNDDDIPIWKRSDYVYKS